MRLLRLVFISIVVLFLVLSFVFALFPSDIRLSKVLAVRSSAEKTAAVIGDLQTWDAWNHLMDKSSAKTFSSPASGKGAYVKAGQMQVTIVYNSPDSIATSWAKADKKPFNSSFRITALPDSAGYNMVAVEWSMYFHFRWYPWEKMGSLFYDKLLGPEMEISLLDLKHYVEKIP